MGKHLDKVAKELREKFKDNKEVLEKLNWSLKQGLSDFKQLPDDDKAITIGICKAIFSDYEDSKKTPPITPEQRKEIIAALDTEVAQLNDQVNKFCNEN